MAVVTELLKANEDGSLSFGNYELETKTKLADFSVGGDVYKVKTFKEITKLEKNEMLVYESEPGTAVTGFAQTADGVKFVLDTPEDAQVILGLEEGTSYRVTIGDREEGTASTNMGGKLVLSLEAGEGVEVTVTKA